jgi:hypothetical protein
MRSRILIVVSAGLNMVFAALLYFTIKNYPDPAIPIYVADLDSVASSSRVKTNVVVRRQNFTWEQVESDNYVTYIDNLREIGCPDATIRDIIVADVNELYAHRRATEVVSADHQWWRTEPDLDAVQKAVDKLKSLESERRGLLTRLLGPGWEIPTNPLPPSVRTGISLTGPVLGDIAPDIKQAVYEIAARTQEKIQAYQEAQRQAGYEIDPMEMTKLRQESRAELAKVLTPSQLEEFLLRYSSTAYQMRNELRGLEFTPDEFRALFRARDVVEQNPDVFYTGSDPVKIHQKQVLEEQRETAIREAIGDGRYAMYVLNK